MVVDRPGQKPCCSSINIELIAGVIERETNDSKSLTMWLDKDMGL